MKYQVVATGHTVNVAHFLEQILEKQQSPLNLAYTNFKPIDAKWTTVMIDDETFESVATFDFEVDEKSLRKDDLAFMRSESGVKLKVVKAGLND